jgi:hypothetical protein
MFPGSETLTAPRFTGARQKIRNVAWSESVKERLFALEGISLPAMRSNRAHGEQDCRKNEMDWKWKGGSDIAVKRSEREPLESGGRHR